MFKSQKLLNKISSSLSPCLCQFYLINFHHRRPRHVYVTNYSANYRRHLMFMAKLQNYSVYYLSEWVNWRQCCKCKKCKAALHFANTKSHNTSSVMRALWGRMKMPPWLKILSTVAEVAGTQYNELTKWCTDLNCSSQRMFLTVAFGDEDANSTVQRTGAAHSWSWKFSRPTLQDRDQDHKYQDQDLVSQDQDRVKLVSCALETKTAVLRTTSLHSCTGRLIGNRVWLIEWHHCPWMTLKVTFAVWNL